MRGYFERKQQFEEEQRKYMNSPENLRLKYVALGFIAIAILLILANCIWIDNLSDKAWHIIRGCAGICAIIFAILIAILYYRVNSANLRNRWDPKQKEGNV